MMMADPWKCSVGAMLQRAQMAYPDGETSRDDGAEMDAGSTERRRHLKHSLE